MPLSRLPAYFVRPAQLARVARALTAALVLPPTLTVHRAIFAQLADTALPGSRAKRALILSMRQALRTVVLPTTL